MRWIVPIVLVLTVPAVAGPDIDKTLAEAEAAVTAGDHATAAKLYGVALSAAHARADLLAEERVVSSMRDRDRSLSAGLDALLSLLDAIGDDRAGAYVTAPLIAEEIVLLATRTGKTEGVKKALAVLTKHARKSKSGKCAAAMRDYALGLSGVAAGDAAAAVDPLKKALTVMVEEGWADLAVHAGTELAAVLVTQKKPEEAAAALAQVSDALPAGSDVANVDTWKKIVTTRLADAPDSVRAVHAKAAARFAGPRTATADGGRGGKGGAAGQPDVSKVGEVWNRLPGGKPFVTAKRTREGFEIRQVYDRGFRFTQPFQHGMKHQDDGGVTLTFWGHGVTLSMVDLEGRRGQPGEASHRPAYRLFHRLARGEVWGVSRKAIVTISRK